MDTRLTPGKLTLVNIVLIPVALFAVMACEQSGSEVVTIPTNSDSDVDSDTDTDSDTDSDTDTDTDSDTDSDTDIDTDSDTDSDTDTDTDSDTDSDTDTDTDSDTDSDTDTDTDTDSDSDDCVVTAEWGDSWVVGEHVPNINVTGIFDQNNNGQIDPEEMTSTSFTLEDIYCATPRNNSVVIVCSDSG